MRKPVIGIACNTPFKTAPRSVACNRAYVQAVMDAGGTPLLLPAIGNDPALALEYIDLLDGVLFAGGEDMLSSYFGEDPVPQVNYVSSERDCLEVALARLAEERDMPMLGICRGEQVLNVAFGGTLWQDIPSQLSGGEVPLLCHYQDPAIRSELTHIVHPVSGTFCDRFGSEPLFVNSFHHQAVKDPAPGFKVCAYSPDGIIEAIESEELLATAVQWHPEELYVRWPRFNVLFSDFVERAAEYAAKRRK
jgi:putative glutamine amidotransferase